MNHANLRLFLSLYGLQGIIVAYLFSYNKTYMMAYGVDPISIATVETLALLPMAFKFLAGPISDRYNIFGWGRRRPLIGLGLLAQSGGLYGLALIDPGLHLFAFGAMAVLAVAGLALNDTCCDGMVVDVTAPRDRAKIQSWLWTARFLAAMFSTLVFGTFVSRSENLHWAIWGCCGLGLIPFLLNFAARESSVLDESHRFRWSAFALMSEPRSLALLAFGGIYGLTGLAVEINLSRYYVDVIRLDALTDVAQLGAIRYMGRAVGAMVFPFLLWTLKRSHVISAGILLLSMTILGQTLIRDRGDADFWAILFGLANGWCDALFATLAMECASPALAASTFALFMAVTNLSVVGNVLFAAAVVMESYPFAFVGTAVVTLLALFPALSLQTPRVPSMRVAADVA